MAHQQHPNPAGMLPPNFTLFCHQQEQQAAPVYPPQFTYSLGGPSGNQSQSIPLESVQNFSQTQYPPVAQSSYQYFPGASSSGNVVVGGGYPLVSTQGNASLPAGHQHHAHPQFQQYQSIPPQPPQMFQFPEQSPKDKGLETPKWMWAIGIADILMALFFSYRLVYNLTHKDFAGTDRDAVMWSLFFVMLALAVQFMMGVAIIIGLRSADEDSILWYCQSWTCGAYFLFVQNGVILLGILIGLQRNEPNPDVGRGLFTIICLLTFRLGSLHLVRRFKCEVQFRKSQCHCPSPPPVQMEVMDQVQSLKKRPQEESTCGMTGAMVAILM